MSRSLSKRIGDRAARAFLLGGAAVMVGFLLPVGSGPGATPAEALIRPEAPPEGDSTGGGGAPAKRRITFPDSAAPDTAGRRPTAGGRLKHLTVNMDDDSTRAHITIDLDQGRVTKASDKVRFGESVHVGPGERQAGDVVAIGGSVTVEGEVSGDCVAIGGNIELKPGASVVGDAVAVAGNVTLDDSTEVLGDAVSVWGNLDRAPTAHIGGQPVEVSGLGGISLPGNIVLGGGRHGFVHDFWRFVRRLIWVLILGGLGVVAFQIFPSRMARLSMTAHDRGLVAFLAGFAGWILWLPAFILLLVTIIGIPVAILLIFLTPVVALLGYLGVAESAGRKVGARFGRSGAGSAGTVFLGVLALEGALLLARFFGIFGSVFDFIGWILSVIGYCVIFIAATMGFGAFLMSRFRPAETAGPSSGAPGPPSGGPGSVPPPVSPWGAPSHTASTAPGPAIPAPVHPGWNPPPPPSSTPPPRETPPPPPEAPPPPAAPPPPGPTPPPPERT